MKNEFNIAAVSTSSKNIRGIWTLCQIKHMLKLGYIVGISYENYWYSVKGYKGGLDILTTDGHKIPCVSEIITQGSIGDVYKP